MSFEHPVVFIASKVMITGDYLKTAIAIAKNVQILQPQDDEVGQKPSNTKMLKWTQGQKLWGIYTE